MTAISIFGLGYVGAVTAVCLGHKGQCIVGVDVNPLKTATLQSGKTPIVEARVEDLARECHQAGRLKATTNAAEAIRSSEISFICVGTPSQRNGKLDLQGIERVCQDIGTALRSKNTFHWIVLRSTVLPGTTEKVLIPALEKFSGKRNGIDFATCFIPEFLREGSAVADFFDPPFTILGTTVSVDPVPLRALFEWSKAPLYQTSASSAEMVKYMCNAFHALKVDFVNEIGTICKHAGVDTEMVAEIFMSDTHLNVSRAYLKPGFAFGGSCLPKDLRALNYLGKELDLQLPLLESLLPSNNAHVDRAVESVLRTGRKKVGLLGLSFKSGTDDLRESPLVMLVKRLLGEGCECKIWDEDVVLGRVLGSNRQFIEQTIPHIGSLLVSDLEEVAKFSEVLLVGTKAATTEKLAPFLRRDVTIIDLVNLDKNKRPDGHGQYEGICW
jgi:GDP-mannose 6-dehydrogenase